MLDERPSMSESRETSFYLDRRNSENAIRLAIERAHDVNWLSPRKVGSFSKIRIKESWTKSSMWLETAFLDNLFLRPFNK